MALMEAEATLAQRVEAALDIVRPGIHADGGDVWLVGIDGTVASVQMIGACGGCAAATATLKFAIEATVIANCPEITAVEQV
jgi:Fe-S cluster biogenesis protein NfuA